MRSMWSPALALALLLPLQAAAAEGTVKGWHKGGTDPQGYVIGTEVDAEGTVAYIRADQPAAGGYGMLSQSFGAKPYRGKRYRLAARIRTEEVADLAVMWLRVDREQEIVAFDNMDERPIVGTTDWRRYEIVLDLPGDSDTIHIGLALSGQGKAIWDDVSFEEVGPEVPVTAAPLPGVRKGPVNLDFAR